MIRDAQNTFVDNVDVASATSNVVFVGGGDAVKEMYLYAHVTGGTGGSIALKTSDDVAMGSAVTLGTWSLGGDAPIKTRIPIGMKKYLQIAITKGSLTGNLSAYLAYDVNVV
jgi:hypothetical protein